MIGGLTAQRLQWKRESEEEADRRYGRCAPGTSWDPGADRHHRDIQGAGCLLLLSLVRDHGLG
jgi:hypothetical protein